MTDAALDTALPVRSRGAVALVLIALAMGGFAIGVTEFAAMSILPDFAAGLGVDAPTAGHVISAYAAGVVVGAPILAVLGARLPRWHLLIGFMALFAVGNVSGDMYAQDYPINFMGNSHGRCLVGGYCVGTYLANL